MPDPESTEPKHAFLVALGIFFSRVFGLIRDRTFAHYFGNSAAADAFRAAFRIPNLLQNLFGEGSLSASFIPVYAKLRAEGSDEEARQLAAGVASSLILALSLLVLAGVLLADALVALIAPGFTGEKRTLTVQLVRIFFPGAGLLVCSAWCLGILNSHRRFFLSYAAPVLWNAVIIAALLAFGSNRETFPLAAICAWASVLGAGVQFAVQLPVALRLVGRLRLAFHWALSSVRTVIRNFVPVFFSRGVLQMSAFVDEFLCSYLPDGAFAAFSYAQTLYLLPVSLFGMSVSASELPEMSSATGTPAEIAQVLRHRLAQGLRRIAFFVVPSALAFLFLGDLVIGAVYQTGRFGSGDVRYVWLTLAGLGVALLAATLGRLYASAFYALRDTRTPLRFALVHVVLAGGVGALAGLCLPGWAGIDRRFGVAGLTAAAALAAWVEFALLRHALNRRIGKNGLPLGLLGRLLFAAGAATALAFGLKILLPGWHPIWMAVPCLGLYGICYFGFTALLGVTEARALLRRGMR